MERIHYPVSYKKELKHLYHASSSEVEVVEVPPMRFLMVDGTGDPNASQEFQEAVESLFAVSFTSRILMNKSREGIAHGVMPLEGLWWADEMSRIRLQDKGSWKWTLMIMQPEPVDADIVRQAVRQVFRKKNLSVLGKLRFEEFSEGSAAQIMHVGPFSQDAGTIERLHDFIASNGFVPSGKHHEIYLSDVRRTPAGKWKTILRQPIRVRSPCREPA
ncbi:MAG: GyrI-like domain-containing protein [bacterium]